MCLLQLQEHTKGAASEIKIMGVEDEAILCVVQSNLGHVRQFGNVRRLV